MTDMIKYQVHGLRELEESLMQIGGAGARRALRKGLRQGANVVKDEAKGRAPVDTGLLKKSISVRPIPNRDLPAGYQIGMRAYVRRRAFYGRFVEFGTSKMAAKPFMRPAASAAHETALKVMEVVTHAALIVEAIRARR